eukprot:6013741-Heterocapsa_arctica.AAC.1
MSEGFVKECMSLGRKEPVGSRPLSDNCIRACCRCPGRWTWVSIVTQLFCRPWSQSNCSSLWGARSLWGASRFAQCKQK